MRWYSVSVFSNFEKKVAENIKEMVEQKNLGNEVSEVLVPTEEVLEIRRGKKVQRERRFMPGYVLVKMDMNEEVYHAIKGINRVSGFLGANGKPTPLPDSEVARIINQVEEGGDMPRSLIAFEVGEKVNVTDGPFEGFAGTVEEVDDINSRLKLTVSIFGRATPVELEFTQVQKQH
tara:strand:- start:804 stop:1331 length:528 start_codon:yes stop_codon:yes gene_type:complete